jgi:hypothetical protein
MVGLSALRDQALKLHVAGGAEEIGADLTLLEWADENAVRPARQQPSSWALQINRSYRTAGHHRAIAGHRCAFMDLLPSRHGCANSVRVPGDRLIWICMAPGYLRSGQSLC